MRIALVVLALAGCAASTGPNAGADSGPTSQAPTPPPPRQDPGSGAPPGADAYRAAIEANEAPFRSASNLTPYLGEDASMDGTTVRPLEVIEDSRCPVDVTCIWAGRVRVRVRVSAGGYSGEAVMENGRPMASIVRNGRIVLEPASSHPGYQQLTLVAVAPLNWARPPAGVDPNARKRFAFTLID